MFLYSTERPPYCQQRQRIIRTGCSHQAPTIKSKLISLTKFLSFLQQRRIYVGLNHKQIEHLTEIANSCKINLGDLCKERMQRLKEFKSSILINSQNFKDYGCSEHVIELCKFIKELENDRKVFVPLTKAIDVRDYLMMILCFTNCLRSSNLMNVMVYDFENAKKHEEIQGSYTFSNTKYKTSLIYGTKIILVSTAVYNQLKLFIKLIRPILINDESKSSKLRYLFTSSSKSKDRVSWSEET